MHGSGVHFMAVDKAKARLAQLDVEYATASAQLDEAIKMGDLRENAEYDIAKAEVQRVTREREDLSDIITMDIVRANDNIPVIVEGSVIHITIWDVATTYCKVGSEKFNAIKQARKDNPSFDGVLMYGATLSYQDLLEDKALSVETPIGKALLGQPSGDYMITVPGGFACVSVEKLKSSTELDELCAYV